MPINEHAFFGHYATEIAVMWSLSRSDHRMGVRFWAIWVGTLTVCSWPILLKNSKMHSLHFLAKLKRDRQFGL
jgi:hypothetical protein